MKIITLARPLRPNVYLFRYLKVAYRASEASAEARKKKGPLGRRDIEWVTAWTCLWARPPQRRRTSPSGVASHLLPPPPSSPAPSYLRGISVDWLERKGTNAAAAAGAGSNGYRRRHPHRPLLRGPPPEAEQPAPRMRLRLPLRPCVLRREQ